MGGGKNDVSPSLESERILEKGIHYSASLEYFKSEEYKSLGSLDPLFPAYIEGASGQEAVIEYTEISSTQEASVVGLPMGPPDFETVTTQQRGEFYVSNSPVSSDLYRAKWFFRGMTYAYDVPEADYIIVPKKQVPKVDMTSPPPWDNYKSPYLLPE